MGPDDVSIEGSADYIGGLVGNSRYGQISSAYCTGTISGDRNVGGLVGENHYGLISSSYTTGMVSGDRDIGALVASGRRPIASTIVPQGVKAYCDTNLIHLFH